MVEDARPPAVRADAIEADVVRKLTPTPAFMERLARARTQLVERADRAARELGIPMVRALVAGSAARGGFLSDRVDIDLFLLFPKELSRKELESGGLELAKAILPEHEIRYAEHPYLRGQLDGFHVDAVPGYSVADGAHPQSAVDRTPFHQEYLQARETPALLEQIRLTKQFLRVLGIYGSEARTAGFSGYLVELLVVRFGSLRALLTEARAWRPPVRLTSTEGSAPRVPEEVALVLDDPVDPSRNVSSALSRRNLAVLILAAGAYLDDPTPAAFEVHPYRPIGRSEGLARVHERATHVAVLSLPRPDLVDDVLFPQLRKAERGVREAAERWGFQPIGTGVGADTAQLVVAVELSHPMLPAVRVRDGPPVGMDRVGSFLEKWSGDAVQRLQGPYVRPDGTLAVETPREHRRFEPMLVAELPQLSLGQDLRKLADRARAVPLAEADDGPALGGALSELFEKALPFLGRRPPG